MINSNDDSKSCCHNIDIWWWAMLVVAVLAVPAIGAIVVLASGAGAKGLLGVAIFIVTCWVCTYLGMRLMHNPKIAEKLDINKKP